MFNLFTKGYSERTFLNRLPCGKSKVEEEEEKKKK